MGSASNPLSAPYLTQMGHAARTSWGMAMKKPSERTDRWIEVEALCRCARMERQYGPAAGEHIEQLQDDERLIAQMRRLWLTHQRWARLRQLAARFWRRRRPTPPASRTPTASKALNDNTRLDFRPYVDRCGDHSDRQARVLARGL